MFGRQNYRFYRRGERAFDEHGLVGDVQYLRTGLVGDADFTGVAAFFQQRNNCVFAFGASLNCDFGTANTDRCDRRIDRHCVRFGFGDRATDERENTMDDGERRRTVAGAWVVNHFVEDHARVFIQREFGSINKGNSGRGAVAGFQHITLEDGIADFEVGAATVGTNGENFAVGGINRADWLGRITTQAGLRELLRCHGPGKSLGCFRRDPRATFGLQRRRLLNGKIIANQNFLAAPALQHQIRAFPVEIRAQQHGATWDCQAFRAYGIENHHVGGLAEIKAIA